MTAFFNAGQVNIVSISGGKDSLATTLVCLETQPFDDIYLVHADTGHEHPYTVDYIGYLQDALNKEISILKADFSGDFVRKRNYVLTKWPEEGVPDDVVQRVAALLEEPTGIPMLDVCILKGRFPSRRAQFCTAELKTELLGEFQLGFAAQGRWAWSWQGVRADESASRRHLPEFQDLGGGCAIFRPVLRWGAADTFEAAALKSVLPNPLYRHGMKRVGCMPCINAGKDEIAEIASRFPWAIERIREWEDIVGQASKRGYSTFFHRDPPAGEDMKTWSRQKILDWASIGPIVEWAQTSHGGRQFDIFKSAERPPCSSAYGLCE